MKYAFAGDRQISCNILAELLKRGHSPAALLLTDRKENTHTEHLIELSGLPREKIFKGKSDVNKEDTLSFLKSLDLDYIIGIHYPYIISEELLNLPKIGFLNLHPAYLPYNKGWNTPSWAILDKTPYGATLHFMAKELDAGDIIKQKEIKVEPYDTADSIYKKTLKLEEEVFYEALDSLISLKPARVPQTHEGTSYKKADLEKIRRFSLEENINVNVFLDKLRALTTNDVNELAYFTTENKKIGVKIEFIELD